MQFDEGGEGATASLLGSYTPGGATPALGGQTPSQRVARTPMRQTSIQDEVRAVAALNAMTGECVCIGGCGVVVAFFVCFGRVPIGACKRLLACPQSSRQIGGTHTATRSVLAACV